MRVAIRADASPEIGTGHVMRSLTLADALKGCGAQSYFICSRLPAALLDLLHRRGHRVEMFNSENDHLASAPHGVSNRDGEVPPWLTDARETASILSNTQGWDWLVVDHYGIDSSWESAMRALVPRILVIDDLCNRRHDCDLLLDQNRTPEISGSYDVLVPEGAKVLLGPTYALVAPEFASLRSDALQRRTGSLKQVLVFMGGSDPANETAKALAGVDMARDTVRDLKVIVVAGSSNPHLESLRTLCGQRPWAKLHVQTEEMAALMLAADLAIGAGGTNTWERCVLGLPALTTIVAENQRQGSTWVARVGAQRLLGWWEDVSSESYAAAILSLSPDSIASMSHSAFGICDGAGATRVAQQFWSLHE